MNKTLLIYSKNIVQIGQNEVLNEGKKSLLKQFLV